MIVNLLTVAVLTALGVPLVRLIDRDARGPMLLGTAFLLALGVAVLLLFAMTVTGVQWPLLAATAFVATSAPARRRSYDRRAMAIDLVIMLTIIGHAIYATYAPLDEWDWFGIWGLKARTFFLHGGIDWAFTKTNISHPDYPLLMPLTADLLNLVRGRWDDRSIGLAWTAICAALVLIVRGMMREEFDSEVMAAVATLAVVSPAMNLWVGLAEAPVMAYGCAGLLYVRRGIRRAHHASFTIGAILLGFAAWSKNEGLALIGVAAVALLVVAPKHLWRLWPAVAVEAIWLVARATLKLQTDFMEGDVLGRVAAHLRQFVWVVRAFARFPPDLWFFWIAAILTFALFARRLWRDERFLTIALTLQLFLLAAQALTTRYDIRAHIELTWNRLPHQLAPAFAFLCAVTLLSVASPRCRVDELPG